MPYDVDAAEDWIGRWAADARGQAGRTAELARRVATLNGSARSPDGSIRVTVGSSGRIEGLELDDPDLARRIRSVLGFAQGALAEKVAAAVRETVGAQSETGRSVINAFEARVRSDDRDR